MRETFIVGGWQFPPRKLVAVDEGLGSAYHGL